MVVSKGLASPRPGGSEALALGLDSCIRYALVHSNDLRRSRIEQWQAKYDEKTALLDFLPTVSGQVSGQYSWGRNVDPETNTYNTITTFNNYYSVGAEFSVFDGGQTINAFRRAKNARAQAATALQKAADDKAIAVMTKFVDAIYNQRSVALAKAKLADSRALLHKTRRLFELGEKSKPDVAQVESQVAEDDYNLLHQRNQARLTMLALKSEMNWELTSPSLVGSGEATPNDSLDADLFLTLDGIDGCASLSLIGEGRGEASPLSVGVGQGVRLLLASQKTDDLQYAWKIARAQLLPSLSFGAGVSTNFYRNLSQGGSVEPFGRQFHNNLGEYVYLSLSVPIFTPSRWRSLRRAKSEWQKAVLNLDDERRKWRDDYAQAVADRDGYRNEVAQMERKVAADSMAYHLSTRKYEEGMLSTFDLHTASQTLLESRIKLLQTRLLCVMKERLVRYYEGGRLW